MVDAYSDKKRYRRRKNDDYSSEEESESPYKSQKTIGLRKLGTRLRGAGQEASVRPSEDIKSGNVRIKANGFRGGRLDSTAANVKMKRGMRVEEVEREEMLEIGTTGDITEIDYEEPASRQFES